MNHITWFFDLASQPIKPALRDPIVFGATRLDIGFFDLLEPCSIAPCLERPINSQARIDPYMRPVEPRALGIAAIEENVRTPPSSFNSRLANAKASSNSLKVSCTTRSISCASERSARKRNPAIRSVHWSTIRCPSAGQASNESAYERPPSHDAQIAT